MVDWFEESLDSTDKLWFRIWDEVSKNPRMANLVLGVIRERIGRCTTEYFTQKETEWRNYG